VKIGLELHGGFSVHTPATLLRLREAAGEAIGANLDPSHMWWQGIDPVQAIIFSGRAGAIHHFHAKDTSIDQINVNRYGVTDMQPYTLNMLDRAWQFRTVGFGHDLKTWADIISALRLSVTTMSSASSTMPPPLPPFRPQVDDVIRRLDDVQVVLDDKHRIAVLHQPMQHFQQRSISSTCSPVVGSSRM
jgi:hypothetical protein